MANVWNKKRGGKSNNRVLVSYEAHIKQAKACIIRDPKEEGGWERKKYLKKYGQKVYTFDEN